MKYQEECEHCGAIITAYTHHLNKPMVNALRQLVDHYEKTKSPANLQKNLNLTKNQYNNFQKLQYFDLVKRVKEGWFPTVFGIDFIYGRTMCHDLVATFGKRILDRYHEAWHSTNKKPTAKMVWEIDESSYKKKDEYQSEKSKGLKLFEDNYYRNF